MRFVAAAPIGCRGCGGFAVHSLDSHLMSRSAVRHVLSIAVTAATLVVLLAPAAVLAHAELDQPTPADGETVSGSPPVVGATYTETLDPDGSSLVLVDATGAEIATGGVVGTDRTKEMSIVDLPELVPGEYTVKSTTKSADDGDVDRTTWSFTVVAAPTPSPTPTSAPSPTAEPSTAAPTATPLVPSPSLATPTPSAAPGDAASSTSDALLPILAALAIVVVAGFLLLRRRNRTSPPA